MISEWFLIGGLIAITLCTFFNILTRNSEVGPIIAFLLLIGIIVKSYFDKRKVTKK